MALKVEELSVLIQANADQFHTELDKIYGELGTLGKTSQSAGNAINDSLVPSIMGANLATQLIVDTLRSAFSAFTNLLGQIYTNGTELSRFSTITEVVAANAGISADKIKEMRVALQDANVYGVEAERVIANLIQSGLIPFTDQLDKVDARTGKTAGGVSALILVMKDLAAAAGVESAEGIAQLTEFIRNGQGALETGLVTVGDMRDEYAAFAKEKGIFNRQLTADEEAQARFNIVLREGDEVFGSYMATMLKAGKVTESIGAAWRSITANFGKYFEPVFDAVALGVFELVKNIRDALLENETAIRDFAIRIAAFVVAAFRVIGMVLSRLPIIGQYFQSLANFSLKSVNGLNKIGGASGTASKGMDSAADSAKKLNKELAGLAGFDEMNVLKEGTSGAGAAAPSVGGGGIGGGDLGAAGLSDMNDAINQGASDLLSSLEPYKELIAIIGGIGLAAAGAFGFLLTFAATAKLVGVAVGTATSIISVFTAPVVTAIAVVAALVATFVLLYTQFQSFRDMISNLAALFTGVFQIALQAVYDIFSRLYNEVLVPMFSWIQANVVPVLDQVFQKISEVIQVFIDNLPAFQAAIQPVIDAVGNVLVAAFQFLGKVIDWIWKNVLKPLVDFILANIVPAFEVIVPVIAEVLRVLGEVVAFIVNLLVPIFDALWKVVEFVFTAIKTNIENAWNGIIKPVLTALWDFITKFIVPVLQTLWTVAGKVFEGIKKAVQDAWSRIWEAIKPVVYWIRDNIMPVINDLKDKFTAAFEGISKSVGGIWEGLKAGFKTGINGIIDFINRFIGSINRAIQSFSELSQSVGGARIDFRVGTIQRLAEGGVINSPTLAMIGEAGREVVMPLDRSDWIMELANKIGSATGKGVNLTVKLGEEKIYEKFVDYVNDRTMVTNTAILNI